MIKRFLTLLMVGFLFLLSGCGTAAGAEDNTKPDIDKSIKINEITYDGSVIEWTNASKENVSYDVIINDKNVAIDSAATSQEFDAKGEDFNVKIISKVNEKEETSSFDFKFGQKFAMPSYDRGVLTWDNLESAKEYTLNIDGKTHSCKDNSFKISETGNITVKVKPVVINRRETKYYDYSPELSFNILSSPDVQFDKAKKTISWNSVTNASGYSIRIEKENKTIVDLPTLGQESTIYRDFDFTEEGNYVIKVCARGDKSHNVYTSPEKEVNVSKLAAPKNMKTVEKDGNIIISWDKVKGADEYSVKLPNGSDQKCTDSKISYPLEDNEIQEKLNFKVKAMANDDFVLDSSYSANIELTKLEKVTNPKMQNGYIVWNSVPMAQKYIINIDGAEFDANTNKYKITVAEGSHKVKIRAIGDGVRVLSSSYCNVIEINKLSAPNNLRFENGVLVWDAVSLATDYNIVSDNGNINKNTNSTNLLINPSEITSSTTIHIIARGNGGFILDSDPSKSKAVYKLSAPVIKTNKYGLEWGAIDGATKYEITIGDYVKYSTGTSYPLDGIVGGSYVCTVKAIGDNNTYFDSSSSSSISVNVLNAPKIKRVDNSIVWDTVILNKGYEVFVDGNEIKYFPTNIKKYTPNFKTAGKHTVSVRAVGDGLESCSSKWSTIEIYSELLVAPLNVTFTKISSTKFKLSCAPIANAVSYIFTINGIEIASETSEYIYETTTPGEFDVAVKGVGNGYDYIDSNLSKEEKLIILNPVSNIKFKLQDVDLYAITWNPSLNTQNYKIEIIKYFTDGTEPLTSNNNVSGTTVSVSSTGCSKIIVKVTALGDGITVFDSETQSFTKII